MTSTYRLSALFLSFHVRHCVVQVLYQDLVLQCLCLQLLYVDLADLPVPLSRLDHLAPVLHLLLQGLDALFLQLFVVLGVFMATYLGLKGGSFGLPGLHFLPVLLLPGLQFVLPRLRYLFSQLLG